MGTSPSTNLDISVSDPSGYEYHVQFESESFTEGKHRLCYIATLSNEKAPKHNKKVVLKVFKPEYVSKFGFDYECIKDLERSITCHELCIKFNKAMDEYSSYTLPISFPAPLRINIKRGKDVLTTKLITRVFNNIPIKLKNHKYLTIQLFLKNSQKYTYNKLSSNNGWLGDKHEFLSAFSHFSWAHTKGKMLITGFQGLQRGNVLFLSDAILHSNVLGSNGATDLGMIGIINFFLNHKCAECCRHLPALNTTLLVDYLSKTSILKVDQATTYLFELDKADLQKDEEKLETVYGESIQQTFADHEMNSKKELSEAGNAVNDTDKMEKIESVIEEMNINKVKDISCEQSEQNEQSIQSIQNEIVEEQEQELEYESDVSTSEISDIDDFEDEDLIQSIQNEENMQNIQINTDMDGSWFADQDESYHEQKVVYDLDAPDGNDEWEFV